MERKPPERNYIRVNRMEGEVRWWSRKTLDIIEHGLKRVAKHGQVVLSNNHSEL